MKDLRKVIVVIDMQNDFITGALRNEEAIKIIPNMVTKLKQAVEDNDTMLVFTQDTHYENYLETQEGKNLPVEHCIEYTKGWELAPEIKPFSEGGPAWPAYRKNTFGSLALATDLKDFINKSARTIKEIEFIGVCTDICVLNNVAIMKAMMPEMLISVDASCCAGVTPESHDTAINAMKAIQVTIKNEGKEPWRE